MAMGIYLPDKVLRIIGGFKCRFAKHLNQCSGGQIGLQIPTYMVDHVVQNYHPAVFGIRLIQHPLFEKKRGVCGVPHSFCNA